MLDLTADRKLLLRDFGEAMVYHPVAGPPRNFKGVVDRQQAEPMPQSPSPGRRVPTLIIECANQATDSTTPGGDGIGGISAAEVDDEGDEIEIAFAVGGEARKRRIVRVVSQDAGMIRLEVAS